MNRAFSKILILIIVVVLIGGGVLIWQYRKAPEVKLPEKEVAEEMAEEIDECKGIQDLDKQSKCYVDLAKETKNETLCGKITAFELRADCYTELAILKNDPSICEKIEPRGSMYESCHEYFEEVIKKPEKRSPPLKKKKY